MIMASPVPPPRGSGLQRLLALEAELEQRLAAVRREAEQVRAAGSAAAAAACADGEKRIGLEEQALTARLEAEHAAAAEQLGTGLVGEVARYGALAPERIEAIARGLLALLLESSDRPAAP